MRKDKPCYRCQACGAESSRWVGRCPDCGEWNTLVEEWQSAGNGRAERHGYGDDATRIYAGDDVAVTSETYVPIGISELDRVLGGGVISGAVILIGGDPGIGKSTLLLQALARLASDDVLRGLYVTGEESPRQVVLRARRLGLSTAHLRLLAHTRVETILQLAAQEQAQVLVVDSIQTVHTDVIQSAPGGVAQVRESAAQLVRFAKRSGTTLFLVGHVTKDGALAGPRVLEHMVDTVLYFESHDNTRFRAVRATKNRFGTVNELGIFAMTETGLREVKNPSSIFLSRHGESIPGSAVTVTREGTRPLLLEVQALLDESQLANPRRVALGLDGNRLAMLLAVLNRHGGIPTHHQDVFVNVVGGIRVTETAADLSVLAAALSSLRNRPIERGLVTFGEIGLAGEVRPVANGEERLREASKHGFNRAIIPKANAPRGACDGIEVFPVARLSEALDLI
jgi:DNA repair protein RadA/Sms